jgi:Fe2+ transport system protein FeoA
MMSADAVPLIQLKNGVMGRVEKIDGGERLRRRLENLGIREGVLIKRDTCISSKGPIVITIGKVQVGLGCGMASKLYVRLTEREGASE